MVQYLVSYLPADHWWLDLMGLSPTSLAYPQVLDLVASPSVEVLEEPWPGRVPRVLAPLSVALACSLHGYPLVG